MGRLRRGRALRDGELQGDVDKGEISPWRAVGKRHSGENPRDEVTGRQRRERQRRQSTGSRREGSIFPQRQRQGDEEGEETTRDRATGNADGPAEIKRVTGPKGKTLNGSERKGQKGQGDYPESAPPGDGKGENPQQGVTGTGKR